MKKYRINHRFCYKNTIKHYAKHIYNLFIKCKQIKYKKKIVLYNIMQEENLKSIQPNKNTKSSHSINRLFNNKIKPILNENISNNDNNIDNTKKIPLIIPDFNTKNIVLEKKYKLDELKKICDVYKLKKSGKKEILKTRIYDFLNHTFYILKIQRCFRKFIVRQLNYYKGPALLKRGICNNDTDFFGFDANLILKFRGRIKDPKNNSSRELFSSMISIAKKQDILFNNPSIGCSIKWK